MCQHVQAFLVHDHVQVTWLVVHEVECHKRSFRSEVSVVITVHM